MASTKEIKDRINSVRETRKITNAMYLIASTKLRKAKLELTNTRPYFEALRGEVNRVFRTVEDVARQNDVTRIRRVTLQLGEVSGVVESYLQDCWKWAAAKSELLPGAVLTVETIPAVTVCEDCGQQYPTVQFGRTCPHCQSPRTHLLQGHEMLIKEIEAVETGPTAPERA